MLLIGQFTQSIQRDKLPEPVVEHWFHPTRRWALDVAWPSLRVGVELHGGTWSNGRHVRGGGFMRDRQKINAALLLGWRVFEFTPDMVTSGEARKTIVYAIRGEDALTEILRDEGYTVIAEDK